MPCTHGDRVFFYRSIVILTILLSLTASLPIVQGAPLSSRAVRTVNHNAESAEHVSHINTRSGSSPRVPRDLLGWLTDVGVGVDRTRFVPVSRPEPKPIELDEEAADDRESSLDSRDPEDSSESSAGLETRGMMRSGRGRHRGKQQSKEKTTAKGKSMKMKMGMGRNGKGSKKGSARVSADKDKMAKEAKKIKHKQMMDDAKRKGRQQMMAAAKKKLAQSKAEAQNKKQKQMMDQAKRKKEQEMRMKSEQQRKKLMMEKMRQMKGMASNSTLVATNSSLTSTNCSSTATGSIPLSTATFNSPPTAENPLSINTSSGEQQPPNVEIPPANTGASRTEAAPEPDRQNVVEDLTDMKASTSRSAEDSPLPVLRRVRRTQSKRAERSAGLIKK